MKLFMIVLAGLCIAANANATHPVERSIGNEVQVVEIVSELHRMRSEVSYETAMIRSKADLADHLANNRNSPLLRLPGNSLQRFLDSLVFTSNGLASYSYASLRDSSLNVTDIYKILALFGEHSQIGHIPGLRATNALEEKILLLTPSNRFDPPWDTTHPPMGDYYCRVGHGEIGCVFEFGSSCNANCK